MVGKEILVILETEAILVTWEQSDTLIKWKEKRKLMKTRKSYKRIKLNTHVKWQQNLKFIATNNRLYNLLKEKNTCFLTWHCAACKGRCTDRACFFSISWISWEKGKGGLVLVRKGSLRKAQSRGEAESNCREAYCLQKNSDATI